MQSYEKRDGHLCFRPSGDLTFFNVAPFSEAVSAAVTTTGIKLVILDCTEIGIVDSAALGALVRLAQLLMGKEGTLKLVNVRKSLRTGIAHARLEQLFPVYDSVKRAVGDSTVPAPGRSSRGTRKKRG